MISTLFSFVSLLVQDAHMPYTHSHKAAYYDSSDITELYRLAGLPKAESVFIPPVVHNNAPPHFTAESVLVVNESNEFIAYEYNADKVVPLASLTKLISTLTALRLGMNADDTFEVKEQDIIEEASALEIGDQIKKEDLLGLALIGSSNSAAHALARATGISDDEFVEQMNITAEIIGLTHTHFVEPSGLDPHNTGTARDVYRLLQAAHNNQKLASYMDDSEFIFYNGTRNKKVFSTNVFKIGILPFAGKTILAAKTGHIPEAGYHFAMTAIDIQGDIRHVIILGSTDHFSRFTEANEFLTWTQKQYVEQPSSSN